MGKTYRAWDVDQAWLLSPSVHDFVARDHPAHLIREIVREELDLAAIMAACEHELRGFPPYHPAMMVALLLYAYSRGIYSSRRIARACEERLDVMAVTALQRPDFRTINGFRKRHLAAWGPVRAGSGAVPQRGPGEARACVALDGTKVKASASKHKAMSYGRMKKREGELGSEVERWLDEAERVDAAEDAALGEARGDAMPPWMADKQKRLEKIREARLSWRRKRPHRRARPMATARGRPRA
jgi:transposase